MLIWRRTSVTLGNMSWTCWFRTLAPGLTEDEPSAWGQRHACIDQPRAYPCCAHGLPWLIHNVQPAGTNARSKPEEECEQENVMPGQTLYCTPDCIPMTLYFRKTCLLTYRFGTACAIEREEWYKLPMDATSATRTWSGTSVIRRSSVPPPGVWPCQTHGWRDPCHPLGVDGI